MVQPIQPSTVPAVSGPLTLEGRALEVIRKKRGHYLCHLALRPPPGFQSVERVHFADPIDRRPLTAHLGRDGTIVICWRPQGDDTWGPLAERIEQFVSERHAQWSSVKDGRRCSQQLDVPKRALTQAVQLAPRDCEHPTRINRLVGELHFAVSRAKTSPDAHRFALMEFSPRDRVLLDIMATFKRAGYTVLTAPLDAERRVIPKAAPGEEAVRPHSIVLRIAEPFPRAALSSGRQGEASGAVSDRWASDPT